MRNLATTLKLLSLLAVPFLAAPASAQSTASQPSVATLAAGKSLYLTNCAICHLANGAGGMHFGEAVSANLQAPALEETYHHDDRLIMRAILQAHDQDNQPLDLPMPAWAGRLSATQAKEIVAYLHQLHA